eukprot:1358186-Amorphochlora_amoeboformis.AAC.3
MEEGKRARIRVEESGLKIEEGTRVYLSSFSGFAHANCLSLSPLTLILFVIYPSVSLPGDLTKSLDLLRCVFIFRLSLSLSVRGMRACYVGYISNKLLCRTADRVRSDPCPDQSE